MSWELIIQEWRLLPSMFLHVITSPGTVATLFLGTLIGLVVGVLPGLTIVMAMALLLGFVFRLPLEWGLALLIGIETGAQFSGGFTAIMINIPGTPAAAATVLDGFPLAKQGRAREAVGAVIGASFLGEILGELCTLIFLPFVTLLALKLGDWEIFLVTVAGIIIAGALAGKNPIKGWIAGVAGLLFAMVGMDAIWGYPRFGYTIDLVKGINFVPALIGLFGLSEVFMVLKEKVPYQLTGRPGRAIMRWDLIFRHFPTIVRATLVGVGIGIIPGIGEAVSPWVAYDWAKRTSRHPEEFGKGSFEGLIAAETADNATSGGALIPTLVLGIPGSGPTAILLAALFIYGVRPGPTLLIDRPGFVAFTVALFWAGALMMRIGAWLLSSLTIRLLYIQRELILPLAVALGVLGAWGSGFTYFDVMTAFAFGVLGYLMRIRDYPPAPMVLGILIGKIADTSLRRALLTYSNNLLSMFLRPAGLILIAFVIFLLVSGRRIRGRAVART
ncbi:MAG: tripartite tricarboxylate transporter permease [Armatimonadota bacterium]|nr:tripartite tricarboxylate transporter permease [Armatimonadota bacterium]MDR7434825.1 tripartite tricarboxylate transporter permease [Armatimonadota bacterium]